MDDGIVVELFPDLPIMPRKVATAFTVGGRCAHCDKRLARGREVYKVAPACCETHEKPYKPGSLNGQGRWVCTTCLKELT